MTEREAPPSLADLGKRLEAARQRGLAADRTKADEKGQSGLGFAFRLGLELVVAVAIGVGIGVLIDRTFGTSPWGLLVFFLFGVVAGHLNVFRLVSRRGKDQGAPGGDRPPPSS